MMRWSQIYERKLLYLRTHLSRERRRQERVRRLRRSCEFCGERYIAAGRYWRRRFCSREHAQRHAATVRLVADLGQTPLHQ